MMSKTPKLRFKEFSGDWEEKRFKDIIKETQLGGNYKNTESKTKYPLIKMGNIARGKIDLSKIEYISEGESIDSNDRLKHGDLLFNTRNTLDLVGKVSVWKNELDLAYYNSNLMRLTFDDKFIDNNYFMNYLFNTRTVLSRLKAIATGTTSVAAIYTRDLQNIKLNFPGLEEQEKIASFFSLIDDKISLQSEKLEMLKDYKKGMMQKIFSRELRFKDDEGRDYPEWEEKKLGDIANLTSSKRVFASDYVEQGIPFYRGKEITELKQNKEPKDILYITEDKYYEIKDKFGIPIKGDLLLTAVGTLGNSYVINDDKPFYFKDGNLIWFKDINQDVDYLNYILTSEKGKKKVLDSAIGSTQKALTIVELNKLKFQFPSLNEQKKIAEFLNNIELKVIKEQEKLDSLNEYKKGLLQQMFV